MGSSEGQTYCLRWNNHKSNLVEILDALIKMESYVDCTIVVDDQVQFKAHRVVLAANSPYFQSILQDVPMDHCSILFPGVQAFEMRALLEYMYTGEVNVTQSQIPKIMKIAEQLEVKGLFDMTDLKAKFNKFDENTTTTASTSTSTTSSTTTNHHHHYSSSQHQLPSTHNTTASSSSIFSSGNNNTEQNNSSSSSGRRNDDNRQTHSNIIGGGNSDLQHNQQSIDLPLSHHHHQQSSPVITTSTNIATAAQSSSSSPPYTTYKSPYSSLYTKSPGPSTSDRQHWPSISPSSVIPSVSIPTTAAAAAMLSSVYESAADMNPLKRKKLSSISSMLMSRDTPILRNVLAQTHAADSSQPMPLVCQSLKQERTSEKSTPSVGGASDYSNNERQKYKHDEPHSPYTDKSFEDDGLDEPKYLGDSRSFSQQSNSQKPEWKRYKQYTRSDILAAIECVRNGMSALQASRKFGVPSRTLYDKVKKLGITTGRPMNRTIKRSPSSGSSPASFPFGLSGTSNPYGQSSTDAILSQIHHESNEHHHHHHHHHHRDKDRGEHHIPSNIPHPAAAALLDPAFLQQAFESRGGDIAGREALHAMALAAAAHAAVNGISTSPGTNGTARSPSPGFAMKYSRSQSTPPPPSQLTRERDRDFMDREIEHEQRDRERERENDMDEEFDRSEREHDRDHEMDHDTEEDENHVEDLSVSRKDTQSPADQISPRPPSNHHSYGPVQQSSGGVIVPPMTKLSPNGGEDFKINIEHKREILTDDARENN